MLISLKNWSVEKINRAVAIIGTICTKKLRSASYMYSLYTKAAQLRRITKSSVNILTLMVENLKQNRMQDNYLNSYNLNSPHSGGREVGVRGGRK